MRNMRSQGITNGSRIRLQCSNCNHKVNQEGNNWQIQALLKPSNTLKYDMTKMYCIYIYIYIIIQCASSVLLEVFSWVLYEYVIIWLTKKKTTQNTTPKLCMCVLTSLHLIRLNTEVCDFKQHCVFTKAMPW